MQKSTTIKRPRSVAPKATAPKRKTQVERSRGNVFADLGLPDPAVGLAKAEIVQQIRKIIQGRGITQAKAAKILGLDQPKVPALIRGRVDGYSLDRLFRFLNSLGQEIEICIRPVKAFKANSSRSRIIVTPESP